MGDVRLRSDIPAENPEKASVEAAIRSVLAELSGSWSAEVSLSRAARWWLISVSRAGDGFQGSVFVNPEDQHPEAVHRLVTGSIQHLR
jgi:hypothetical protein